MKDAISLILQTPDLGEDLRLLLGNLQEQLPVLISMNQSALSVEQQHSEYLDQRKKTPKDVLAFKVKYVEASSKKSQLQKGKEDLESQ